MSPAILLIVRTAARLSAANRAESRLVAAEWADQVAARPRAAARAGHALMLLVAVGVPARARRCVLGVPWGVVTAGVVVHGVGLAIVSFAVRARSERIFVGYGPDDQAADPAFRAWEPTYGEAMQPGDPAAFDEAWTQLLTVGPWRISEELRQLADVTLLTALAVLLSAPIALSLAVLGRRWRRRQGTRLGNA